MSEVNQFYFSWLFKRQQTFLCFIAVSAAIKRPLGPLQLLYRTNNLAG